MSELLQKIAADVAESKTNIDWIKRAMERGEAKLKEHDKEIDAIKGRQNWFAGAGTAVGLFVGSLVSYVLHR
jgi:hypothetical protein